MTMFEAINQEMHRLYERYGKRTSVLTPAMTIQAEQMLVRKGINARELTAAADRWMLEKPAAMPSVSELVETARSLRSERRWGEEKGKDYADLRCDTCGMTLVAPASRVRDDDARSCDYVDRHGRACLGSMIRGEILQRRETEEFKRRLAAGEVEPAIQAFAKRIPGPKPDAKPDYDPFAADDDENAKNAAPGA